MTVEEAEIVRWQRKVVFYCVVCERHEVSAIDYNLLGIDELTDEMCEEGRVSSSRSHLMRSNIFKVKQKISEYE